MLTGPADLPDEPVPDWRAPTEWTRDGKLRHPRYQGLRTDKNPLDVVRETV